MAITPADIENMTFSQAGKHEEGYKTDEVDVFLDQVASEVDAMLQKIADLKGRLTTSEQQLAAAQAQVAQLKEQTTMAAPVEPAPVPVPQSEFTASERQISQVLMDDADSVFPQQTLSVPNGSKGTTHTDSVVASTPVIPAVPVADAEATTYAPAPAANDFSDLD